MVHRVSLVNTNRMHPPVAPIAFDYLHEPLVRAGFAPRLLDLCFSEDWRSDVRAHATQVRPLAWGVTVRNTEDVYYASNRSFLELNREIIAELRRAFDAPVILGGAGFSAMPQRCLEFLDADYGVVGEGEVTLPLLLDRILRSERFDDVPNLVYRDRGRTHSTPRQTVDLAAIPVRKRDFVDNYRYFVEGGLAAVETKRGCNRPCAHCVEPIAKGRQVRRRPPHLAAEEVQALVDLGVTALHINDSEFNLDVEHAVAFCEELIARGLPDRMGWYAYGVPRPFPAHLAKVMVRAGCKGMNFGVDSACDPTLRLIRRTFDKEHIAALVDVCRTHDLRTLLELSFGWPGEGRDSVEESIGFMKQIDAELVMCTAGLRVFPGTHLETLVRAEGLEGNPSVRGYSTADPGLFAPVYYLSASLGPDPTRFIERCIDGDPRFFPPNADDLNYCANTVVLEAIARGERGAYWSMLAKHHRARVAPC